jgi:hypothetical protein
MMEKDKLMELYMVTMLSIVFLFHKFVGSFTNTFFSTLEIPEGGGAPNQARGQLCLDEDHLHS